MWVTILPSMMAASARMIEPRMSPCPPLPVMRSSKRLSLPISGLLLGRSRAHQRMALDIYEFADDNFSRQFFRSLLLGHALEDHPVLLRCDHLPGAALLVESPKVRRALGDSVDKGETVMGDSLLEVVDKMFCEVDAGARHIRCTGTGCQLHKVEWSVQIAVRGRRRDRRARRKRRRLPAGHPVVVVVEHHDRNIDVSACGMDQMVAADCRDIAVTGDHDDRQVRIGQLNACCHWNGVAMKGVHIVEGSICRCA